MGEWGWRKGGDGREGGEREGMGEKGIWRGMVEHIGAYFSPFCWCDTQAFGRLHRLAYLSHKD